MNCFCGHVEDEHLARGEDKEHPGSTACTIEDCPCLGYDWDGVEDE